MQVEPANESGRALVVALVSALVHAVVAVAALVALFVTHELKYLIGWELMVLLAACFGGLAVVAIYGAAAARQTKLAAWPLPLTAGLLPLLGAGAIALYARKIEEILRTVSIDVSQRATLRVAGLAESLIFALIATVLGAIVLSCAATALGARALGRAQRLALVRGGALPLAVLGMILVVPALRAAVMIVPSLAGAMAVTLGGVALAGTVSGDDAHERAWGETLAACATAVAAVLVAGLAARVSALEHVLAAVPAAPPGERLAFLARGWEEAARAAPTPALFALPPVAAAAAALGASARRGARGALAAIPSVLASAPAIAALVLVPALIERLAVDAVQQDPLPADVVLALEPSETELAPPSAERLLLIGRERVYLDARELAPASALDDTANCARFVAAARERLPEYAPPRLEVAPEEPPPLPTVALAPDGDTRFARLWCLARALARREHAPTVVLVLASPRDVSLAPLFHEIGPERVGVVAELVHPEELARLQTPPAVTHALWLAPDSARLLVLGRAEEQHGTAGALVSWLAGRLRERPVRLVVLARADTPASLVLRALALARGGPGDAPLLAPPFEGAFPAQPWAESLGWKAPSAPPAPSIAPVDATMVLGRLRPRLRACYSHGLKQDPTLAGTATLTAKIGPSGDVTAVDATSTGTLAPIVPCLKEVVQSAKFSPPEGGGAVVTVPITFVKQE